MNSPKRKKFPLIRYTSRDFESIKRDLNDHRKRYYSDISKDEKVPQETEVTEMEKDKLLTPKENAKIQQRIKKRILCMANNEIMLTELEEKLAKEFNLSVDDISWVVAKLGNEGELIRPKAGFIQSLNPVEEDEKLGD